MTEAFWTETVKLALEITAFATLWWRSHANGKTLKEVKENVNGHMEARLADARRQREPQVLVVDDSDNDLRMARERLEEYGCTVFEAKNFHMARNLVLSRVGSADGLPFHLILLDWSIPGSDVMDYLTFFKEYCPRVRVVIFTNYSDNPNFKKILTVPRTVFDKPLTSAAVQHLLEECSITYYKHP